MIALFLTTTITCSQALGVIQRIQANNAVPSYVRIELINEILQTIPTCPVKVKEDERRNSN